MAMKRLLATLAVLALSACATSSAVTSTSVDSTATITDCVDPASCHETAPKRVAATLPCDEKCVQRRRSELDRLLKLGAPKEVTVAASSGQ
jgi:ABC-type Fe3+-hydroxamate transport system substrate-binding protein